MNKELLMWSMLTNEAYNILDYAEEVLAINPNKTLQELYNKREQEVVNNFNTMSDDEFVEYANINHGENYVEDVFKASVDIDILKYQLEKYKVHIAK